MESLSERRGRYWSAKGTVGKLLDRCEPMLRELAAGRGAADWGWGEGEGWPDERRESVQLESGESDEDLS